MTSMEFNLTYKIGNTIHNLKKDLLNDKSPLDEYINLKTIINDNHLYVELLTNKRIKLIKASIDYPQSYEKDDHLFFNGYQTWTYSKEDDLNSYNQGINKIPLKKVINRYLHLDRYAELHFMPYKNKKGFNRGWTYSYIRNGEEFKLFGSLNENMGFTVYEYDKELPILKIIKEVEGSEVNENFILFDVAILKGKEDEVFDEYFKLLNISKPNAKPLLGYTSWYNYYQNINEEIIDRDLDSMIHLDTKIDIFQIDDGYESFVGDWLDVDHNKFPNGLKPVVDKIHNANMKAGLWLSPFTCETNSRIYKEHPDWIIKDEFSKPFHGGCNWSQYYGLDIYNKEVRDYIEKVFDTVLNIWGFDLVKLDFLYCACLKPIHGKNRGQIMHDGMVWLREICKDKLILGCGVPLGSVFGLVDYCRIGCDMTLDYNDKKYMQLIHNERPSTKQTMIDTIFRRQLDGRAFLNDPDVFLLREDNTKLTIKQKKDLATINGLFGSLLFVSDNVVTYNKEQLDIFKNVMKLKRQNRTVQVINNKVIVEYLDLDNQTKKIEIDMN